MSQAQLNVSNLFKESFNNVGSVFVPLVLLSIPAAVLQVIAVVLPGPLSFIVNMASFLIVTPILGGAAIYLIHQHLNNREPDVSEAIQQATGKAVNLILAYFLYVVIVAIGFICLLIPGIYLSYRLVFVLYTVMLQDASGTEALGVSWRLTQGRWWSIFLCLLAAFLLLFLVPIIVTIFVIVTFQNDLITQLSSAGFGLVVGPILGVYSFLVYKTLRQRDKGDSINRALT